MRDDYWLEIFPEVEEVELEIVEAKKTNPKSRCYLIFIVVLLENLFKRFISFTSFARSETSRFI